MEDKVLEEDKEILILNRIEQLIIWQNIHLKR